jgi:hypothetical protein
MSPVTQLVGVDNMKNFHKTTTTFTKSYVILWFRELLV